MERLADAIGRWKAVLGPAHVVDAADALVSARTATFSTESVVHALLRPGDRQDVQACVNIARECAVPLYPYSTGKNWGYGSRAPVRDGVLLDLGRLNRILDFSEDLAYVTVEPGVTQRQLFTFLQDRQSRLWMDATGASPDCSLIGNTLERGFGHTPLGDHCSHVCGFEVVLPTGECIETGFSRFPSTKAGALGRWGLGPSLDGLFSQSSFGVVTRMTVWLMPAPECFQAFFFTCGKHEDLPAVIDALRPLRLDGTLRSVMHIGNDYKAVAAAGKFPWGQQNAAGLLDLEAMAKLRRALGMGCWTGAGGLYGTKAHVADARRRVRRALHGKVQQLQFVDDRRLRFLRRFATPLSRLIRKDIRPTLRVLGPVIGLMKGIPTDETLGSAYWRKRGGKPGQADPDRDGCGLIWCSPVVPTMGANVQEVTSLASDVLLAHGFEPQISVSLATERMSVCVITIAYDREVPGDDERAFTCYQTLTDMLLERGYPPYRLNVASMASLAADPSYANLLRRLKSVVDPEGILAPGRYEPPVEAYASRRPVAVASSEGGR